VPDRGPQTWPAGQEPLLQSGNVPQGIVGIVAVVLVETIVFDVPVRDDEELVLVVVTAAPHESQQLGLVPSVLRGPVQRPGDGTTLQRVPPVRVMQHVAKVGRPQVDRDAQRITSARHEGGREPAPTAARTASATHRL
jgi:hypothetical protein